MVTAPASGRAAPAESRIRLSLDWKFEGPAAPFLVALDRGYFAAEGLDVTIEPGMGSVDAVKRVASGAYDMAVGDINTLIRRRADDDEIGAKAVFMLYEKPPFAVIGRKSRGISDPRSLQGKTIGAPPADAAFAQWPLFAHANAIDMGEVKIQSMGFGVREPMLAAGEVDAVLGYSYSAAISLRDKGVPASDIVVLSMADHGVPLYGNALIVDADFAEENPEAIKGFIRALLRGLRDTLADPDGVIDSVLDRNPSARREVELERLKTALSENVLTPTVREEGIGDVDMERLSWSIALMSVTYGLKQRPAAEDVFDASFLPAEAERQLD
jgi:NitT/TauT family transport system substrate-binding protein